MFPFFYKTKILITGIPDVPMRLRNAAKEYGLKIEKYNPNEYFFTFDFSFVRKPTNGISGTIHIVNEGNDTYAVFHIYNKILSIILLIVFLGTSILFQNLVIGLFYSFIVIFLCSIKFFPFASSFVKVFKKELLKK